MSVAPNRFRAYLEDYASHHRTHGNRVTHYVGIPLLTATIAGMLALVTAGPTWGDGLVRIDLAILAWIALSVWYVSMDWKLGVFASVIGLGFYAVGRMLPPISLPFLFVGGWIIQYIGHGIYEKRSPAFYKNIEHLFIGPVWVFARIIGYIPAVWPPENALPNQGRSPVASLVLASLLFAGGTSNAAEMQPTIPGNDVFGTDNAKISLQSLRGDKGTAIVFISTECPISNGYVPTLNQMHQKWTAKGIALVLLNPNDGQSAEKMAEHRAEFELVPAVYKDEGSLIAKQLGVTHCPEACLFDAGGKLVYRGRIDDRYRRRGASARPSTMQDLEDAIVETLAGNHVKLRTTDPVGCPIALPIARGKAIQNATVNYSEHVLPVLMKHCQACHRDGGMAPFSLTSYEDAASWAEDIRSFTSDGTMPPWKPVNGHGEFLNQRRLSEEEKGVLARWVEEGCAEGDPSRAPSQVQFKEGWQEGTPDIVLEPESDFVLDADGADVYRNFVFPTNYDQDLYMTAYEILPSNHRVVHHVLLFADSSERGKRLDERDPGPGYTSNALAGLPGFVPSSMLGGWAPGNSPHKLRGGLARRIPKGSNLIMQVHYSKTGKRETDRTKIGLHISKETPRQLVGVTPLEPVSARVGLFAIPKNDPNFVVSCNVKIPRAVSLFSVTPHMHLVGRSMRVTAKLPTGESKDLVYINDWDFNWQETYYYRDPVTLPAGSQLEMVARYDNSSGNPNNPHQPPQTIKYGEQTSEEMCICFFEAAWADLPEASARLSAPSLEDLFEAQVDPLMKFLRR
ncbi:MAG: Mpo1-like protein [Planctomycetota bacterium]